MKRVRFRDPMGIVRQGRFGAGSVSSGSRTYALNDVDVLPPSNPSKIIGVGLNYHDHVEEGDMELPDHPILFMKPPVSVSSHGSTIELPDPSKEYVPEAELGVVIGEEIWDVDPPTVPEVIAGYTCGNDFSNTSDMQEELDVFRGKIFDGSATLGPVIASPEEVPDDAAIRLSVNGSTRQDSTIDEMIFSVQEIISEISQYVSLLPGDVILTGTPAGVEPVDRGDDVEIEIEGIGTLEFSVG